MVVEAVIISDIHLGSSLCQAKLLNSFLHQIDTKKLIINGDLFDGIDFRRLDKNQWKVLSKLRKLSKKIEVIYVVGNHDEEAEHIAHLIGVSVVEEYRFESGGKKIICIHGDSFDLFMSQNPVLTWIADLFYNLIQKVSKLLARKLKLSSKIFLRCIEQIKTRAIEYKNKIGYDFVICGHSHLAFESEEYVNCGSWIDNYCTYVEIDNGNVKLKEFKNVL